MVSSYERGYEIQFFCQLRLKSVTSESVDVPGFYYKTLYLTTFIILMATTTNKQKITSNATHQKYLHQQLPNNQEIAAKKNRSEENLIRPTQKKHHLFELIFISCALSFYSYLINKTKNI